jgi:TatA/E family protein of Tat protein translocase
VFGISGFELLIIVAFVLLIFGPDKIPELARVIGRGMRLFKDAQTDMERVIRAEMITGERPASPLIPSVTAAATTAEEKSPTEAASAAAGIWAATSEDDEEEDEE